MATGSRIVAPIGESWDCGLRASYYYKGEVMGFRPTRGRPLRMVLAALAITIGVLVSASGAFAAPPKALVLGDSVSGGASSPEASAAATQGFAVTVVSGATWNSYTAADFGQYDLLVVGDPYCSSSGLNQATANSAVWAPVVMGTAGGRTLAGNRILIGTDPVLHGANATNDRGRIIRTGIAFAGKQPGRTGIYFDTSCDYSSHAGELTALTQMSTGTGTWTASNAAPCGGAVSLIASEPSFAGPSGLTSSSLQGWGCSVHQTYPTFTSDWSPLAVATDAATKPNCGVDPNTGASACGQAYILISGSSIVVVSGSIALAPLSGSSAAGGSHTVTAHLTAGGSPLGGKTVTFTITGQNAGVSGSCVPAGCVSDVNGDVAFTYTDVNGAGSDTIKGSFVDAAGSLQAATAAWSWTAPLDADLSVRSKVDSADPVIFGSTFTYTITVGNAGPAVATGVVVTDTLPVGLSFVSGAGCSAVAQVVTCTVGTIPVGGSASVTFSVHADAPGTFTDTATVSGTLVDLNPANNSLSESTTVLAAADLAVRSKTDSADPVNNGDTFSYTVTISNAGPSAATGVVITDVLPVGLAFVSGAGCSAVGQVVSCTIGNLAVGATASATFTVQANASGTFTDTASVNGVETDPVAGNNSGSQTTTVAAVSDLSVTKTGTASIYWGNNATYTVKVKNLGPDDATSIDVTDSISGPATFVSGSAAGGACTISAGLVHCPVGALAAGATSTVTLVVSGDDPGTIVDKAHAQGAELDPVPANDADVATTTVLAHPTSVTYTGDLTSDFHDAATLSAVVKDTVTGAVLAAKPVQFTLDAQSCNDSTNALGVASCTIVPNEPAGSYLLTATYPGGSHYLGDIAVGTFTVTLEQTKIVYTGFTGHASTGTPVTLSAVLKEDGVTPLSGRTVWLTIGSQSCTDLTNGAGVASCSLVIAQPAGPAAITAFFAGDAYYLASADGDSATISEVTKITYTGAKTGDYHDAATLSAKLVSVFSGNPIAGVNVTLSLGAQSCVDATNAAGVASCAITPNVPAGSQPIVAKFAGTALYDPSSDTDTFAVTLEQTKIAYTGVTGYVAIGSTVTLSAVLKEDGVTPISGRTVTLTLSGQSCVDTTNAAGVASCTVTVAAQPTGPNTVTASFAGDAYYLPATDADSVFLYAFAPGGGAFVVGDRSATGSVTFWGAQWWKLNVLSGGAAPASFKGYAKSPSTPSCGATWATDPGNSTPPPAGPLPTFMAVLVTSSSTKSGSQISGNTPHIVLVKTAAGYDANPGHAGTGTVIATLC